MKNLSGKAKLIFKCALGLSLSALIFASCSKNEPVVSEPETPKESAVKTEKPAEKKSTASTLSSDLKDVGSAVEKLGEDVAKSDEGKSLLGTATKIVDGSKGALDTLTSSDTYKDVIDSITSSDGYKNTKEAVDKAVETVKSVSSEDLANAANSAVESLKSSEVAETINTTLDNLGKYAEDLKSTGEETKKTLNDLNGLLGGLGRKKSEGDSE